MSTGDEFNADVMASLKRLGEASQLLARSGVVMEDALQVDSVGEAAALVYAAFPSAAIAAAAQQVAAERDRVRSELEKELGTITNPSLRNAIQSKIDSLAGATSLADVKAIQAAALNAIANAESWGNLDQSISTADLEEEKKLQDMLEKARQWMAEDAKAVNRAYECGAVSKDEHEVLTAHQTEIDALLAKIQDMKPGKDRDALMKELQEHAKQYAMDSDGILPDAIKKLRAMGLNKEADDLEKVQTHAHEFQKDVEEKYKEVQKKEKESEDVGALTKKKLIRFDDEEEPSVAKQNASSSKDAPASGNEDLGQMVANIPKQSGTSTSNSRGV